MSDDNVIDFAAASRKRAAAWMRDRPQLRELFLRLPPACTVRAVRTLLCPRPGTVATVVSYTEDGDVGVQQDETKAFCDPAWLEPVAFERGMTVEWVKSVFEGL